MSNEHIKYIYNEITFFVPNCRSLGTSCNVRKWTEKAGFVYTFSDAPFSGRWVKLSLPLNSSKPIKLSTIIENIENCCAKCRG